jgi:S-adenosylmethionine:tRNA-ribosyltransferase-isomerase (queuine synthetase)
MSKMKLSDFDFNLPEELIANYPEENRDECRLMVVHRSTGLIEHKMFRDVLDYFDEGDVMIMNNTRVFPARMYGNKEKTGLKLKFSYCVNSTVKVFCGMSLSTPLARSALAINCILAKTTLSLLR